MNIELLISDLQAYETASEKALRLASPVQMDEATYFGLLAAEWVKIAKTHREPNLLVSNSMRRWPRIWLHTTAYAAWELPKAKLDKAIDIAGEKAGTSLIAANKWAKRGNESKAKELIAESDTWQEIVEYLEFRRGTI